MTTTELPETPTFGLWYDYRNPAQWKTSAGELYRRSIDQAVWAEQLGFGSAWLSEHHFADDDYASSPLIMAAVLAARTATMRIGTNIIVAGLRRHRPVAAVRRPVRTWCRARLPGSRIQRIRSKRQEPAQPPRGRHRHHPPSVVRQCGRL